MRTQTAPERRERRLSDLAGRQFGVVTRTQMLALGFSAAGIGRRVDAGRLLVLHRGVYAVGHAALRRDGHALAAQLACGPAAVLSHGSAADHLGLLRSASASYEVTVADLVIAGGPESASTGPACWRQRRW